MGLMLCISLRYSSPMAGDSMGELAPKRSKRGTWKMAVRVQPNVSCSDFLGAGLWQSSDAADGFKCL